ncbi:hypothetical protein CEXT_4531 [Caerostris extrusa]|uniref:Ycf15 n=1 Tax=Caerostris extrusa TaxID=172846 RepID=A0AAV4XWF8_CAEEX|nr:hypothetical protein CEXT_4531 [Caerostris extrusa]
MNSDILLLSETWTRHIRIKWFRLDHDHLSSLASIRSSPLVKNKTLYGRSPRRRQSKAGVWAESTEFCRTN